MGVEFKEFPKMARLTREMIITEKIDGTNASIFIQQEVLETREAQPHVVALVEHQGTSYTIRAGSRNKWITPGGTTDNAGFAGWVRDHAKDLILLGEGHHFGEWWGSGIQRGYGLKEKRFSLFNVARWKDERPVCTSIVPILFQGIFSTTLANQALLNLAEGGSAAAPGFMKPEGIVVWHVAANMGFKKTIEKDEVPKSLQ